VTELIYDNNEQMLNKDVMVNGVIVQLRSVGIANQIFVILKIVLK